MKSRRQKMANWADLPRPLWEMIFERCDQLIDRLRFMAVCLMFHSIGMDYQPHHLSRPLLLLPPPNTDDNSPRELYSLADYTTYNSYIPELQGKWCCGSSFGWLFTVNFTSEEISLINPITRAQILLPPISTFPKHPDELNDDQEPRYGVWVLEKAIFSLSPSQGLDFIVMAIINSSWSLAFCKPGYNAWLELPSDHDLHNDDHYEDVAYYKGKFYAIFSSGGLIAWDLSDPNYPTKTAIIEPPSVFIPYKQYLVESIHGELFKLQRVVRSYGHNKFYKTVAFDVYKLDQNMKEWVDGYLHNQAVFVGYSAVCVSTLENPEFRGNGIYFADDNNFEWVGVNPWGCNDVGFYDWGRNRVQKFYELHPFWEDPCIWFIPSL